MQNRKHYVVGIDYGTLSSRAVLVDTDNGNTVAESVTEYKHGVMDERLPDGRKLPPMWALQDPQDYLDVLENNMKNIFDGSTVNPDEIASLDIDFTTCTLLAVDGDGIPLCFDAKYKSEPHAYAKLWKHHAAQPDADVINALANERHEPWLKNYGGKISCEWMFPKILQMKREAPDVYRATARFVEAGDWVTWMLTGRECHSAAYVGYKGLWNRQDGYPSDGFFSALEPSLKGIIGTKVSTDIVPITEIAGKICEYGSKLTGLEVGMPVAPSIPDGHAGMPGSGITSAGQLYMVIGTSACFFVNTSDKTELSGISGVAKDGVIPGCYTYESGQSGCGDIFEWFMNNCVPEDYEREAKAKNINIHTLFQQKAGKLRPGESGLIALDWLNGNRCPLSDGELTGLVLGMTLKTKPEEIYRAWLESVAFGAKTILDNYENNGVAFDSVTAGGGIAIKNPLMMQIYADVFGKEIRISGSSQAGALGCAIYASVSGGIYKSIGEAAEAIAPKSEKIYYPDTEAHKTYEKLYAEYMRLQSIFGKSDSVMKNILKISNDCEQNNE